ncbi:rSAM-partnered protein, Htur_1727 family [Halorubrum aquaticum]|uniref:RSAM-partnered protein, Htur_1727 family n=1 Tax=Halorubrum aquaticum TaxID=387340 RepID=A0A1I3B760_9EURY|nr:Htur_1727 family rSAM-partnered candidate RiPP [Halorubrum aquaticum]SFH58114.1 rSAM-partnered protein, Htur_1727 family [Halorubrum aquaticum]
MVEKAQRSVEETPRRTRERRWEVFVRESKSDPMRRVGTVAAPSPAVAHEEASRLFAWYARDVWLCPADETHRFSTYSLAETEDEEGDAENARSGGEPRVHEETEGTPRVRGGEDRR